MAWRGLASRARRRVCPQHLRGPQRPAASRLIAQRLLAQARQCTGCVRACVHASESTRLQRTRLSRLAAPLRASPRLASPHLCHNTMPHGAGPHPAARRPASPPSLSLAAARFRSHRHSAPRRSHMRAEPTRAAAASTCCDCAHRWMGAAPPDATAGLGRAGLGCAVLPCPRGSARPPLRKRRERTAWRSAPRRRQLRRRAPPNARSLSAAALLTSGRKPAHSGSRAVEGSQHTRGREQWAGPSTDSHAHVHPPSVESTRVVSQARSRSACVLGST